MPDYPSRPRQHKVLWRFSIAFVRPYQHLELSSGGYSGAPRQRIVPQLVGLMGAMTCGILKSDYLYPTLFLEVMFPLVAKWTVIASILQRI
jgi:hypothetical protein